MNCSDNPKVGASAEKDGSAWPSTVRLLNDAGQLTSRGRRWTPNRILGVLRNPTYIAELPFTGERHQANRIGVLPHF